MINSQIKSYNGATRDLLDKPIRDEKEYGQLVKWLKEWASPEITKTLPLPQEWADKILDQMNEFKNRE